ncbi:MAG: DUF5329 domain-containing protein [Xanthomonadaceae bacterium]|nr:DUF5329 domain-containing protein [Xanthomonadaceae bacterium]
MRRILACLCACAVVLSVQAAAPTTKPSSATANKPADAATAQREIEALIAALGRSGCSFERNGEWYDGARARTHLGRKYDYLRRRDPAGSAESFIERAASRSSTSGRAYHVRCPGKPVESASTWFQRQLRDMRAPKR